jgi:hypothetical protein
MTTNNHYRSGSPISNQEEDAYHQQTAVAHHFHGINNEQTLELGELGEEEMVYGTLD